MIFRKTLRGKLISIDKVNDKKEIYTIQEDNGKKHTIIFEHEKVGTCSIGDEVYLAYNNTPLIKNKKGLWLTKNIYLANKKANSPYFQYTQPFLYRIIAPFILMSSAQFFLTLYNVMPYWSIFLLTFVGFFFIQHFLGRIVERNRDRFVVEKATKDFFNQYVDKQFSFQEKTLNKKIDETQKTKLRDSINNLDISATLKFEYMSIIDNNDLLISDIRKIEYYREKSHVESMSNVNYN